MRLGTVLGLTVAIVTVGFGQGVEVEVGFSNWGLDGNQSKFRQYSTPAQKFFLRSLQLAPSMRLSGDVTKFLLKGSEKDDYRVEGVSDFLFGKARASLDISRHRFFDASPFFVGQSQREVQEGAVKYFLTPDFAFSVRYRMDKQDHLFEVPKLPLYQRTRFWDAIAEGKLGDGQLHISYADWRYFDRTEIRPNTTIKRMQGKYSWDASPALGVESGFARFSIKQPARPSSDVETLFLSGNWAIGAATEFSWLLRRDKLELPVVQNAWVRERRLSFVDLTHRWRGWTLKFGYRQQEAERIRKDQTFVDTPRWRTFDLRVSGRILPKVRLTLRSWIQRLTHPPTMVTTDPRQLFWDDRKFAQLRLEGGSPVLNGYLVLTHRHWENSVRAIDLKTNSIAIGGSWQASNRLNFFAEYAYEAWRAKSEMVGFPTLDNFVPNSRVTTIGLNWAVDRRTFLSVAFTDFVTNNDNPLLLRDGNYQGRFLTASLRYRFPAGYEIALTFAPWRYRDRVVDLMDYDATVVMVSGSARF